MTNQNLLDAMGNIDPKLIMDAAPGEKQASSRKHSVITYVSIAACVCLLVGHVFWIGRAFNHNTPSLPPVQSANPMMEVSSTEEMAYYLGFDVPLLSKEVKAFILFITDSYATMGQITYADGSIFRIQMGHGDISGIYGGNLTDEKAISGIPVSFYQCGTVSYAIWETDGYAFSYSSEHLTETEIEQMINNRKGNR